MAARLGVFRTVNQAFVPRVEADSPRDQELRQSRETCSGSREKPLIRVPSGIPRLRSDCHSGRSRLLGSKAIKRPTENESRRVVP